MVVVINTKFFIACTLIILLLLECILKDTQDKKQQPFESGSTRRIIFGSINNSLSAKLKIKCLSDYTTKLSSLLMKNPTVLKVASENASFLIYYEDILNSVYDN